MSQNKHIAEKWFQAFNEHQLENLLALYSDDAVHFSPKLKIKYPETNGLISGKNQLRKWWQEAFQNIPSLKYHPQLILCEGNFVFMEYNREVDGEPNLTVGELLEIENGVIIKSKVYHS